MSAPVKRGGRWAAVPGRALRDTAMTPKLREVLLSVCYYAHQDGRCVVKIGTLAGPTGTDERNMRRYLATLRALGYLEITERTSNGLRLASAYRVLHDAELPPERDRAATPPTIMVDADAVAHEDVEDIASDDRPGSEYPDVRVTATPHARVVSARGKNTEGLTPTSTPSVESAGAAATAAPIMQLLDEPSTATPTTDPIGLVFDAWKQTRAETLPSATGRVVLNAVRRKAIKKALAEYPVEEVVLAARGWRHFPHNRGENDRGRPFEELDVVLALRNIERFRDAEADPAARPAQKQQSPRDAHAAVKAARRARIAEGMGALPTGDERRQIGAGGGAA